MSRITDCEKVAALLSRRIDEALSPVEGERIQVHLHTCAQCREADRLLRSDQARRRTFARFDARLRPASTRRRLASVRIAVAVIAAGVSLLVPLEPLDSPLPDSKEIQVLHALHETHTATALPGLPESAIAEESSEQP